MRSYQISAILLILLAGSIAQDKYGQSNDCSCQCNCKYPFDKNNNGNTNSTTTTNTTDPNTNTGGNTGGNTNSTSGKKPRDFKAWFANMQKDPWGNSGLPTILKNINPVIRMEEANKWLEDITNASKVFPDFCNSGNEQKDKQEFAAFLTIIGAETSFNSANGFPCTQETGCPNCEACSYNSKGKECATNPNKQYFGRGPLQLSWDYNYINFSKYYFNDDRLMNNPNILTESQQTCWASAIWFWMTPQNYGGWCMPQAAWPSRDSCSSQCPNGPTGCANSQCDNNHWLKPGKISPHDAIQTGKGIGQVINVINGGYDCCPTTSYLTSYGHTVHRVEWYAEILQAWGAPLPFSNLSTVPIEECPAAQNKIDCSRLSSGTCTWGCCSAK